MLRLREWVWAPLLIFASIVGPGLATAKASPATDSAFISTIEKAGIGYTSRDAAITAGHAVCTLFDYGFSFLDVGDVVLEETELSPYQAGWLIGAATFAFCDEYAYLIPGARVAA